MKLVNVYPNFNRLNYISVFLKIKKIEDQKLQTLQL